MARSTTSVLVAPNVPMANPTHSKQFKDEIKFQNQMLFLDVHKVPLSTLLKSDFDTRSENQYAIVDQNKYIHGFCSNEYLLTSNESLVLPFEQALRKANIQYSRKVRVFNKSQFYITYIIQNQKVGRAKVNDLSLQIELWNSYDGKIMRSMHMGYYRLVCSNGLTRPVGQQYSIYSKHMAQVDKATASTQLDVIDTDKMMASVYEFMNSTGDDMRFYAELSKIKATEKIIKQIGDKMNFSDKIIKASVERFQLETSGRHSYVGPDGSIINLKAQNANLYVAYNALNYGLYRTNLKELPKIKLEKDTKLISLMSKFLN